MQGSGESLFDVLGLAARKKRSEAFRRSRGEALQLGRLREREAGFDFCPERQFRLISSRIDQASAERQQIELLRRKFLAPKPCSVPACCLTFSPHSPVSRQYFLGGARPSTRELKGGSDKFEATVRGLLEEGASGKQTAEIERELAHLAGGAEKPPRAKSIAISMLARKKCLPARSQSLGTRYSDFQSHSLRSIIGEQHDQHGNGARWE